jgi:hypothetical protein
MSLVHSSHFAPSTIKKNYLIPLGFVCFVFLQKEEESLLPLFLHDRTRKNRKLPLCMAQNKGTETNSSQNDLLKVVVLPVMPRLANVPRFV